MIALLLETVIAGLLAWASAHFAWWAPLILFPVIMGFGNYNFDPPMPETTYRIFFDFTLMLQQIGWVVVSAVISYHGFGAWWGTLLGVLFGFCGATVMAPRRWAKEVHQDRADRFTHGEDDSPRRTSPKVIANSGCPPDQQFDEVSGKPPRIGVLRVAPPRGGYSVVDGEPLYLGSLALMLHFAASHANAESGMNIAQLLIFFSDVAQWPRVDVPLSSIPEYPVRGVNQINNYRFCCEKWARGIIEVFRKDTQFAHVGFQTTTQSGVFGARNRIQQCLNDVITAAKHAYGAPLSPRPVRDRGSSSVFFRDKQTLCTIMVSDGATPILTYRIWNRELYDPDVEELLSLE